MTVDLSESEIHRYARHILLAEIGGTGQTRLKRSRVLVVGAGGLGSPLALYLAAAGVGTIGLADDDTVDLSNLQRQVAHTTDRLGWSKIRSAAVAIAAINPEVRTELHPVRLDVRNAAELIGRFDLVCDGSDNFPTRFVVNDACVLARRTLVSAAVIGFSGQLSTFRPHRRSASEEAPCYRCFHPASPAGEGGASCAEAGVLGAVAGVMGTLQATEAIKELLGLGDSLSGRLLLWEALAMRFRTVALRRDPDCPACGAAAVAVCARPDIKEPAHAARC